MFNRRSYKEIARKQLKGRHTAPVLTTLFVCVIYVLLNTPSFSSLIEAFKDPSNIFDFTQGPYGFSYHYEGSSPVASSMSWLLVLASYLVTGAVLMAQANLYIIMSHTTEPRTFGDFIKGFSSWLSGFLGILWYMLWVTLWSFLFIFPGIVKAFSYSQMFFIMAEHPNITVTKAMNLSKVMTKGYKGDLFVMCLSFIGWDILCALTCGILNLWITPYKWMTFTNAYHALKAHAIQAGDLRMEDFTGEPVEAANNGN